MRRAAFALALFATPAAAHLDGMGDWFDLATKDDCLAVLTILKVTQAETATFEGQALKWNDDESPEHAARMTEMHAAARDLAAASSRALEAVLQICANNYE